MVHSNELLIDVLDWNENDNNIIKIIMRTSIHIPLKLNAAAAAAVAVATAVCHARVSCTCCACVTTCIPFSFISFISDWSLHSLCCSLNPSPLRRSPLARVLIIHACTVFHYSTHCIDSSLELNLINEHSRLIVLDAAATSLRVCRTVCPSHRHTQHRVHS